MSIRIENCIQHPKYKDKYNNFPVTVNLLLIDNQDNIGFDWKAYLYRYDHKVNEIRKNSTISEPEKKAMLEKLLQQFQDVKKYRQRFVVGHDVYYNTEGIAYDKQPLNKNVSALHISGQYHYAVKYLHPKDRELKILDRLKTGHIHIQNLISFDIKYAIEREKNTLQNLASDSSSQPIATVKRFYIPIIMPHYHGDLTHFMLKTSKQYKRILDAEEILNVLLTVSNVYSELMDYHLFYTDIKPGNIFYREYNGKIQVVVGDLGGMVYVHHNVKCDFAPQTFPYPHKNYQMIKLYHEYKNRRDSARNEEQVERVNKWYVNERDNYYHKHHSPRGDLNYNARNWEFRQRYKMENIVAWGVAVLGMTLFMTHERDHRQYVLNRREPIIMEQSVRFTRNLEFPSFSYSNRDFSKYEDGVKSIPGYLEFREQLKISRIFREMVPKILKKMFWLEVGDMQTAMKGLKEALDTENNYRNNLNSRNFDGNSNYRNVKPHRRRKRKRRWVENSISPSEQEKREARKRRFGGGGLVLHDGKIHVK